VAVSLALFTRNLRVCDNPVLAVPAATGPVLPLFVLDEHILTGDYLAPNRASFLVECLTDLDAGLRERGAGLVIRRGRLVEQVCRLAERVGAGQVHIAADVSGYDQARRRRLAHELAGTRCELMVHDTTITAVAAGRLTPPGRDHFAVFTPYYRRWVEHPPRPLEAVPTRIDMPEVDTGVLPDAKTLCPGIRSPDLAHGGETAARRRLRDWAPRVREYPRANDQLAARATSRLSPYLHFGCLSPVELVTKFRDDPEATAFLRQLAWRDFHHQVLAARPDAAHRDYRDRDRRWRHDEDALQAWRCGRTGIPIVDAGMRQLAVEGWMNNRSRLIVASFLTKTLYLDWRAGARHFLDLLSDGDIANNQLNWQWMAGTGTDTRPNRMLNPLIQARRTDPDGAFVRRYVPELAEVKGAAVHEPWKLPARCRRGLDYPNAIVDLDKARRRFRADVKRA
jgi:deoxyribodipyrimidine photo-lyase